MAPWLSERLGQPVVVENKPGASSNISIQAVVNSPPDGYTLLFVPASAAVNVTLFETLPFNLLRDIAPVSGLIDFPLVMVANPSLPAKTIADLVAHAKANPGKISIASFGTGSTSHVAGELFKMMTGVNMIHVPYRGGAAMVADLMGGQVQVGLDVLTGSLAHIRSGTLRALAVAGKARSDALPDVPTIGETVAGYEANSWCGVGVGRGTPPEVIERLNREINAGLGRSGRESAACRRRHHANCLHSRRVRRVYGGRGREVGQGGQGIGHQAGVIGRHLNISAPPTLGWRKIYLRARRHARRRNPAHPLWLSPLSRMNPAAPSASVAAPWMPRAP
jgi:tripartite-type tricarboxylate transporter receptor subunit TctC